MAQTLGPFLRLLVRSLASFRIEPNRRASRTSCGMASAVLRRHWMTFEFRMNLAVNLGHRKGGLDPLSNLQEIFSRHVSSSATPREKIDPYRDRRPGRMAGGFGVDEDRPALPARTNVSRDQTRHHWTEGKFDSATVGARNVRVWFPRYACKTEHRKRWRWIEPIAGPVALVKPIVLSEGMLGARAKLFEPRLQIRQCTSLRGSR